MKSICILYYGNTCAFPNTAEMHLRMLGHYSKSYTVDTFCCVNKMDKNIVYSLQPKNYIFVDDLSEEFRMIKNNILENNKYINILNYMDTFEQSVNGKKNFPSLDEHFIYQCISLKKGIEVIENQEKINKKPYDIFMFIKYEFVTDLFYNFSYIWSTPMHYIDVLTCCNSLNSKTFLDSCNHYQLSSDSQIIDYLRALKVDRYAGCLYTTQMKNINLGGKYVKNFNTIENIFSLCSQKKIIDNTVYFVNDAFFFVNRTHLNKFKYLFSELGQFKFDDAYGTAIFSPEYQYVSFCQKNNLLPIIYSDISCGGIYSDNVDIMNKYFIPAKKILIDGKQCEKNYDKNTELFTCVGCNTLSLKYAFDYGYIGENIRISFNCISQSPVMLLISLCNSSMIPLREELISIKNGPFSYNMSNTINDNFFMVLHFIDLNNSRFALSNIKIVHTELIFHYITFITEGGIIDGAYDLRNCDAALKQLTDKYTDNYFCFRLRDLDNIDEKKYITVGKTDKKQVGGNNINSEKIAFFKWKPYIIYKYLQQLPDNHILLYRDGNIEKYKNYLTSFETIKHECTQILSSVPQKIWFVHENVGIKSVSHQKKYLTDAYKIIDNEFFFNHDLVNASTVLCQKTPTSLAFLEKWIQGCLNDSYINHEFIGREKFVYKWHCNDQAVLNSIIISMKQRCELDWSFPYYRNHDRELTFAKCNDLRKSYNYDGFVLNKMNLIADVPQYSHGCKLVRNHDFSLNFVRTSDAAYTPFQWIGYEINSCGKFCVSFNIRFKNILPDPDSEHLIGFKTHHPVVCYDNWIKKCSVNNWCEISLVIDKPTDESDLFILVFDNSKPSLEFDLQNFVVNIC